MQRAAIIRQQEEATPQLIGKPNIINTNFGCIQFQGEWRSLTNYKLYQAVKYQGRKYINLVASNTNIIPGSNILAWEAWNDASDVEMPITQEEINQKLSQLDQLNVERVEALNAKVAELKQFNAEIKENLPIMLQDFSQIIDEKLTRQATLTAQQLQTEIKATEERINAQIAQLKCDLKPIGKPESKSRDPVLLAQFNSTEEYNHCISSDQIKSLQSIFDVEVVNVQVNETTKRGRKSHREGENNTKTTYLAGKFIVTSTTTDNHAMAFYDGVTGKTTNVVDQKFIVNGVEFTVVITWSTIVIYQLTATQLDSSDIVRFSVSVPKIVEFN